MTKTTKDLTGDEPTTNKGLFVMASVPNTLNTGTVTHRIISHRHNIIREP